MCIEKYIASGLLWSLLQSKTFYIYYRKLLMAVTGRGESASDMAYRRDLPSEASSTMLGSVDSPGLYFMAQKVQVPLQVAA